MFRPRGDAASLESEATAAHSLQHESIADEPRPRDPEKDARNERLASALYASVPSLERLKFDYKSIGKVLDCSPEDARLRVRYVELDDTRAGMQITLFEDDATITLAREALSGTSEYEARDAIRTLWRILEVCEREASLRTYDEQLNKVLSLDKDFAEVLARFTS